MYILIFVKRIGTVFIKKRPLFLTKKENAAVNARKFGRAECLRWQQGAPAGSGLPAMAKITIADTATGLLNNGTNPGHAPGFVSFKKSGAVRRRISCSLPSFIRQNKANSGFSHTSQIRGNRNKSSAHAVRIA